MKSTSNDCNELKAIKYKTLLQNGIAWPETKTSSNLENLDKYFEGR